MDEAERDRRAYLLAREFLLGLRVEGVTAPLLERYLRGAETRPRPDSVPGVYLRLLESAQNAGMRPRVVGGSIGGVRALEGVLLGFEPAAVVERYPTWEHVFGEVRRSLRPAGEVRDTPRSLWPLYCRTILSAARFMARFATADDFYGWVDFFDRDERARPALPLLLDQEIEGVGFALACDFLKELGYVNFAKPDVHLRDIFVGLGLCEPGSSDLQLLRAVVRVAGNADVTPYAADKLFWLVGSGYFHDDPHLGRGGRIGGRKKEFIAHAQGRLRR